MEPEKKEFSTSAMMLGLSIITQIIVATIYISKASSTAESVKEQFLQMQQEQTIERRTTSEQVNRINDRLIRLETKIDLMDTSRK